MRDVVNLDTPRTEHRIIFGDSRDLSHLQDNSVDLVVTSPPYPMIQMWDEAFTALNPDVGGALAAGDGPAAFALMHRELDQVWRQCLRILRPGAFACINIGDAVRTLGGDFRLYPNHARILSAMHLLGFHTLPDLLWRKPTNSPTKFMGSGMLPAGAYVTYEHEYILIFRKGSKRRLATAPDQARRRASAFFWEERNVWFSDLWTDLRGTSQDLCETSARRRSAAFPFELAYRLICMYSLYGDTVCDPFLGTGTTTAAAIAACRNSLGSESQWELWPDVSRTISLAVDVGAARIKSRLAGHLRFIRERLEAGHTFKYTNAVHGFPVMTAQEQALTLYIPHRFEEQSDTQVKVAYRPADSRDISGDQPGLFPTPSTAPPAEYHRRVPKAVVT